MAPTMKKSKEILVFVENSVPQISFQNTDVKVSTDQYYLLSGPGIHGPSTVRDFQNFVGPVRDLKIFLGPGTVPSFEMSRSGPRFLNLKLSQSWSELFLNNYIFPVLVRS